MYEYEQPTFESFDIKDCLNVGAGLLCCSSGTCCASGLCCGTGTDCSKGTSCGGKTGISCGKGTK